MHEIPVPPVGARELQRIRRGALAMAGEGEFADRWPNHDVLRLIAEIDRLAYMWWRGGTDDLITDEPSPVDGHRELIINGAPTDPDSLWRPPPAESWTLPPEKESG